MKKSDGNGERFAVRGFIEGFYGKPWTHTRRLEMLRFAARHKMNTYYYAPKDDPYHRKLWRENYPENELVQLKEIANTAEECGIEMHYCIAPGLSIRYSSEEDRKALFAKLHSLYTVGIKNFGLLLDDIPEKLFYSEDREIYGDTVNAHTDICLRCYDELKKIDKNIRFTVCPLQYHGKGTEEFITRFASALPDDVYVFFTGADICSKELTCREAKIFENATGHKPLYWDNFPVNDAEMFKEMHIAPLIGRDPELYKYAHGIISNCMEYFECNKFALATAASYMYDPKNYDPEESFSMALHELLPEEVIEDFILFADHLRTSCLHDENSRIMGEHFGNISVMLETGNFNDAVKCAEGYTAMVRRSANALKHRHGPLFDELEEWLEKYYLMADILDEAVDVLKGGGNRKKLEAMTDRYNRSATVLTSFCFREYIENIRQYRT